MYKSTQLTYPFLHPFTYMPPVDQQSLPPFMMLDRGEGSWVYDEAGNKFMYLTTAVPSIGLGNSRIIDRICKQFQRLSYASTCEQNHAAAATLAERLISIAGKPMSMAFFTMDGSGAVETAMKLARQYFITQQQPQRTKFVSIEGNYHGTTFGSGSVTHMGIQASFGPGLEGCYSIPSPYHHNEQKEAERSATSLQELRSIIQEHGGDSIAAFVVELVQGVNGAVPMPKAFIQELAALTSDHGILLIVDEVTTGLGRTGSWLASHDYLINPDIILLSKGLTGGYFPMGAALFSEQLRDSMFGRGGVFLHGSTQNGHPVGCEAALAVLDMIEEGQLVRNAQLQGMQILTRLRSELEGYPYILDIRGKGLMIGIEFVDPHSKSGITMEWGGRLSANLRREGILGNFFNGALIIYPPLNITSTEAEFIWKGIVNAIRAM
ncbi:aminotransferase class III-fold pyridoxal phosphate-dependent enzyme [Paenibacillus sp. 453mf]|uniref:aminotransferase family protein n=1 Tax=Paenibacillus sp. 453mf TaxID=1761874 RepID=UPI0008F090D8|nr:aminotransferase class III-fold pyridoxal phosphate-dependent enzyme [Paenibacillus sp. 453mf]SFS54678.1 Adenosylmethionine-8-amino-7-oxononanoate aminotransferase [Paenibacillus sp. 453mf]